MSFSVRPGTSPVTTRFAPESKTFSRGQASRRSPARSAGRAGEIVEVVPDAIHLASQLVQKIEGPVVVSSSCDHRIHLRIGEAPGAAGFAWKRRAALSGHAPGRRTTR